VSCEHPSRHSCQCPQSLFIDYLPHKSEKWFEQLDDGENSDFLLENSPKNQHQVLGVIEDKAKAREDQGRVAQAGSDYQHISSSGNSFQVNGDIGDGVLDKSK